MRLSELLVDLKKQKHIISVSGIEDIIVSGVAYDSRRVMRGSVFVCIEGFKMDGHKFIADAIDNGAVAIVVQKPIKLETNDVTIIMVDDSRFSLASIANTMYNEPSKQFNLIGVTGTNGKTTTTYLAREILMSASYKVGLIGTIANRICDEIIPTERTTPESLDLQKLFSDMVEKSVDSVVMEVSSHSLELSRVDCCDFDIGVFTNLTQDHLDFHGTFDNYLNAKAKLFKKCRTGFVNVDDSYSKAIIDKSNCKVYTYGIDNEADIMAKNIDAFSDGVEFEFVSPWGSARLRVGMPGKINVYNAIAAAGVTLLSGCSMQDVKDGLVNAKVPGRSEVVPTGRDFTMIVDYAHTPDGLENILKVVRGYAKGRVVCIFGCGGDRDKTKRPMMGEIAGRLSDFTIITSDNPRTEMPEDIITDIEEGIKTTNGQYIKITERKDAIRYSIKNARTNDIILLAGKGHETYQTFKDKTIHFDEREVIRDILNEE